jgi:hypothetical protein
MRKSAVEVSVPESSDSKQPFRVRLPAFISERDEIGLGDVIKRATASLGLQPCGGCDGRAARLNRLVVFSRGRRA